MTASQAPEAAPHLGRHSARKKDDGGKKSRKKRKVSAYEQEETFPSDSENVERAPTGLSSDPCVEPQRPAKVDAEKPLTKKKKSKKAHAATKVKDVGGVVAREPESSLAAEGTDEEETAAATAEKESAETGTEAEETGSEDEPAASDAEEAENKEENASEVIVYRQNEIIDSSQSFKDFAATHLDRRLTKALIDDLKLQHPTHVQSKVLDPVSQVIPFALNGRDLLIEGRTGSGKTLAYVLPLLQRLLQLQQQQQQRGETAELPPLCALVLVPTKELCIQVYDVLTALLKYTKDVVTVSHTASPAGGPGKLLGPPTVMVGTPTGVLQYLDSLRQQQHRFDMQLFLEMLIVDEADLLFAFGFEKDTKRLLQLLPSTAAGHYQTILVSATQNQELSQLQNLMLHKPLIIRIEEEEGTPGGPGGANPIGEFYFQVPSEAEKWLVAYAFLRLGLVPLKCLVFCKDVSNVYALRLFLDRFGIASGVLSPTLPIAAREQQIQAFNQGLIDILITNDGQYMEEDNPQTEPDDPESAEAPVNNQQTRKRRREDASKTKEAEFAGHRGLDLQGVACVFNFDAPNSLKSYIHRIGRTGRGGAAGVAVTLIDTSQEQQQFLLQQMFTMRKATGALGDSTLTPLSLQLQDVECFRYRVEDVRRGITKRAIAAAVARDLQQQLLNSRKLKEFFERNPRDREVLKRACKQLKEMNVSKGTLGHLPDYLLSQTRPTQMTAIQLAIQQQTAGTAVTKGSHGAPRRRPVIDPLKSFKAAVSRSAPTGKRKAKRREIITRQSQLNKMPKHPDELAPECLPATSGRKLWKLRHNKRVGVKDPKGNFLRKRSTKGLRKK